MTAFTNRTFSVACSSGGITDDEARARWEAVFGPRPERACEYDRNAGTMHFLPCECQECVSRCRICGVEANAIRDGRIVLVTSGRCSSCAALEQSRG